MTHIDSKIMIIL